MRGDLSAEEIDQAIAAYHALSAAPTN